MRDNTALRAARERIASPSQPGYCLGRQELAELVNNHIWEHQRQRVELDANYIGKLERGLILWPARNTREALRVILRAPSDASLGFSNTRRKALDRLADDVGTVDLTVFPA